MSYFGCCCFGGTGLYVIGFGATQMKSVLMRKPCLGDQGTPSHNSSFGNGIGRNRGFVARLRAPPLHGLRLLLRRLHRSEVGFLAGLSGPPHPPDSRHLHLEDRQTTRISYLACGANYSSYANCPDFQQTQTMCYGLRFRHQSHHSHQGLNRESRLAAQQVNCYSSDS